MAAAFKKVFKQIKFARMRIVHVLSGLTKGGGERIAVELANQALANGDVVTILAGWHEDPAYLQNTIHPGVDIRFVSRNKSLAYLKICFWIVRNRQWICSQDILHGHLTFGTIFGSLTRFIIRFLLHKKTPAFVETNHAVGMPVPAFKRWVQSRLLLQRDGIILMAKDPFWNNFLVKHPSLKAEIIPNGIAVIRETIGPEQKKEWMKKTGIPENAKYIIGSISMLRADRNPLLYVPLFHEIYKALGNDVHFVLGGSGEEQGKIEKLVNELGLADHFHLLGLVNEPAKVIANLDVYVSVSVGETAGISMIEAAMCMVPVVGIQLIENYQTKKEDWVWSATDINAVAGKIIFFLTHQKESYDYAVGQEAYVKKQFSSATMYKAYRSFYEAVINA